MKLRVAGTTYTGAVVDLRARTVDGRTVAASIRGRRCLPAVSCPEPPAVYVYAGHVHPSMGLRTRTALAAAARSRGYETPQDDAIADCRAKLAKLECSPPELPDPVDPVSESTIDGLQEAVATHRGRLTARQAVGADDEAAQAALRDAATELSERETRRAAVSETRELRRERARAYRDTLEEQRRFADELANLRRSARATLVDRCTETFARAIDTVPGPVPDSPFDADPVTAALGVLRFAKTPAPVVLETNRFRSPTAASDCLDAPVVRC
ncbi:hypothetical protein BVU17_00250 [Haloarcula taiwanensis]|uniref:Uncharacterized protein n=1 Tax=Haloarcula taiwanensis TaxID=1932004 RepID=A0A2H4ZU86_9EURY|nr:MULTISPECIES: hypothetical protein [Haloarcula]AUG46033.1 hypothetical protein BVU17_00250 [Haloarcula taiwanensis]RLM40164.1 hypothetical protein DVK01_06335 [Haloarcula sp. Atlit-120R]RLM48194.1 hypothetical protein DVK00_06775 [Haloarcula sp. Atlit-47R]RLM96582.1 hypothetical protein D3D01_09275 [Haloarcula sp. Atlit-7R]